VLPGKVGAVRPRPFFLLYSPKCVEGLFCELRLETV
jgi:hypothetical protein